MKNLRNLPLQPRRDAWVEVNLGALERNARLLRSVIGPEQSLMAIVKADAYGHGAAMVIPTLEASGIGMVGVAAMDEALHLRKAGLEIPVLVIGVVPDWAAQIAAEYDIELTVFDAHHLDSLRKSFELTRRPVKVHVKVDTGMHRIGIDWREAGAFIRHCRELPGIQLEGVFTHLACTDDPAFTQTQLERWETVVSQVDPLPRWLHVANSAGALRYSDIPKNLHNMVRLGIALFGYEALPDETVGRLLPVMGLKARIIHLQDVPEGQGVSYNHTFRAEKPSRIATLPLGYADGVPRALSNRIFGLLRGQRVPQVGKITMDQMMFDISALPGAGSVRVGETVTLIGEDGGQHIDFTEWAAVCGSIPYELMCGLRVRLPKTYTR